MQPIAVLGATAVLVLGCASQASSRLANDDVLAIGGQAESERDESAVGPADLRVELGPIRLRTPVEPSAAVGPGEGHSRAVLEAAVMGYRDQLMECAPGIADAALAPGEFSLYLELSADGYVMGGSTNPSPGQAGISAVAGCVLKQARAWLFPSRERRGRTILIIPFVVAGT